jgi:hypothetical protein
MKQGWFATFVCCCSYRYQLDIPGLYEDVPRDAVTLIVADLRRWLPEASHGHNHDWALVEIKSWDGKTCMNFRVDPPVKVNQ